MKINVIPYLSKRSYGYPDPSVDDTDPAPTESSRFSTMASQVVP
ncbi:hypothetical protein [Flavobacterium sp. B183]|nr:hypothetical protein [Flavobacterium sp. B183]